MAFPQVQQVKTYNTGASDVNPLVPHTPDTVVADELWLLLVCIDSAITGGGSDINLTAGWTQLFTFQEISTQSFEVWAKKVVGNETGDTAFNISIEDSQQGAVQIYRISDWFGTIATGVEVSTRVDGQNPPSLSPAWGAADTLWIAAAFASINTGFTSYPTNYSANGVFTSSAASSGGSQIASGRRELNASSEDPGTFTWTTSADTLTIAVRPLAASNAVIPVYMNQYRQRGN